MKRTKKAVKRGKATSLKAKRLRRRDEEKVRGGTTPTPGGPIPMPYPTVNK